MKTYSQKVSTQCCEEKYNTNRRFTNLNTFLTLVHKFLEKSGYEIVSPNRQIRFNPGNYHEYINRGKISVLFLCNKMSFSYHCLIVESSAADLVCWTRGKQVI